MKAVVTVTGRDKKGIIAKVSTFLSEKNVNIEDVSQTILGDEFAMIMAVDIEDSSSPLASLAKECEELGKTIGVTIRMQHVDIFNAMHTV